MKDRLILDHEKGFPIIVPTGFTEPIPLFCDVCQALFKSSDDENSYREFKCCYLCALNWAHPRRKEWKDGWRPTPKQISEVIKERVPAMLIFDID